MKVLYKNKVGSLVPLEDVYCHNRIYYSEHSSIAHCKNTGLMKLCVGILNYSEFTLSSSDVFDL